MRAATGDLQDMGWQSENSVVEWGAKGQERERNGLSRYGSGGAGPVSPLPRLPRETMRVFPNGRAKLGGKEVPTNF